MNWIAPLPVMASIHHIWSVHLLPKHHGCLSMVPSICLPGDWRRWCEPIVDFGSCAGIQLDLSQSRLVPSLLVLGPQFKLLLWFQLAGSTVESVSRKSRPSTQASKHWFFSWPSFWQCVHFGQLLFLALPVATTLSVAASVEVFNSMPRAMLYCLSSLRIIAYTLFKFGSQPCWEY